MKKGISYFIYWLLQCTWGFIMTFIGAVAALGLIVTGHKPKRLGPTIYFEVGHNWGGVELGGFFICDCESDLDTKYHECGHSLQNIIWGPLFPFLIAIPSAVRYWLRECKGHLNKVFFSGAILFISLIVFTLLAWLMTFTGIKFLVILMELFRIYFTLISIWLTAIEIPRYVNPCHPSREAYVDYDSIWFEGQATRWGVKVYGKKEG